MDPLGNNGFNRETVRPIYHELPLSVGCASLNDTLTWLYTLRKLTIFLLYNIWSSAATRDKRMGRIPEGPAQNSGKQQRRDSDEY